MQLDTQRIRDDFPILRETVNGRPLIYLDNAATTQKPRQVIDALVHYYEHQNANIHRGIHTLAVRATDAYEGVRPKVARFLGGAAADEVVFTRNTTEAINLVAYAWGGRFLGPGDEIVLTQMEHHSNIVPWQLLAQRVGATVRFARVTDDGYLDIASLRRLLGPHTKAVSVTHMSNVLGVVNPIAEIAAMAHEHGAILVVDGAQSAPHLPVNVRDLGCDFFAFSAHKMFGPTGVGVLWGASQHLDAMDPFLGGGDMIAVVREEGSTWADLPHKFEAGTPNIADVVAFGAALDYLAQFGMPAIRAHERELTAYAMDSLLRIPGVAVQGPLDPDHRGGAVSFTVEGVHPHDVSTVLDAEGIAIRAGHHCTQILMRRLGVAATNRASFALYNERGEVDALASALRGTIRMFSDGQRAAV